MTDTCRLTLQSPAHGGFCTAKMPDGKVALIAGGLPGEEVEAKITRTHKRYVQGEVREVLTASADRQPHIWPAAKAHNIGGVDLGHVSPAGQSAWKEAVLTDTLRRIGSRELVAATLAARRPLIRGSQAVTLPAALRAPDANTQVGSRTRFRTTQSPERLPAMFQRGSKTLVEISDFPLAVPALAAHFAANLPTARERGHHHVISANGECATAALGEPIALCEQVTVAGERYRYQLDTESFWQAHYAAPSLLANAVRDAVGAAGGGRVLELYSGVGLFTVPLARLLGSAGQLRSYEVGYRAVGYARENVNALGGDRALAQVRRAKIDARMLRTELADYRPETLVLDPPREGVGEAGAAVIANAKIPTVVMVSCDIAAMARDLRTLHAAGYAITAMQPFDLFDYTHHLEIVTTLQYVPSR